MDKFLQESGLGYVTEARTTTNGGVEVGSLTGLATTYIPERPFDSRNLPKRFEKTAFDKTIEAHKARNDRPIRILREHVSGDLIGGAPISEVHAGEQGLEFRAEINLQTQLGRESYALAEQGVLSDISMGYSVPNHTVESSGDIVATEVNIFEFSLVGEPANHGAQITSLESLTPRSLEKALIRGGFSRSQAKEFVSKVAPMLEENEEEAIKSATLSDIFQLIMDSDSK